MTFSSGFLVGMILCPLIYLLSDLAWDWWTHRVPRALRRPKPSHPYNHLSG